MWKAPVLADRTQIIFAGQDTAFTFNDFTLQDNPTDYAPFQTDTTGWVTTDYKLKTPIIAAAMDTVCEAQMAVALAKNGSMGVIHRNLSIEEQVQQVNWVRRQVHFGGMIDHPICFNETQTVADLQRSSAENKWSFTSFPIVSSDNILVGLVTRNELDFVENNPQLRDVMLPLQKIIIAATGTNFEDAFEIMSKHQIKKLPVVNDVGELCGMYVWSDVRRNVESRDKMSLDKEGRLLVAAAVGPNERERAEELVKAGCPILVIDCSHGACGNVLLQIDFIRNLSKTVNIIAGNVASFESARLLLLTRKINAIKVGISIGTICTTRKVTGHGMPQMTAIFEALRAIHKTDYQVPIIADGGITCSGDIIKAFAIGASCVMAGSLFAGTDEAPGQLITRENKKYKSYRGMGSRSAMTERSGSRDRYFGKQSKQNLLSLQQASKITPEGIDAIVEYKGSVVLILNELIGGVQSGLAHSGAQNISELPEKAVFWRQTTAGVIEGNPHNVQNF